MTNLPRPFRCPDFLRDLFGMDAEYESENFSGRVEIYVDYKDGVPVEAWFKPLRKYKITS